MKTRHSFLFLFLMAGLLLQSCTQRDKTGPAKVHWDREVCPRCRMAVSDHHFSAQIRGGIEGKRTKVHYFDDFGCAILWLYEQKWKDSPRTEIWVNHYTSGEWIDARKSAYVKGQITPMDYRLGAIRQGDTHEGTSTGDLLHYDQAVQHVFQLERERTAPNRWPDFLKQPSQNKDIK